MNATQNITVIIYQPAKSATQSKRKEQLCWGIRITNENNRFIEPLMRHTGNNDTLSQLSNLFFSTSENAVKFCQKKQWKYTVEEPHKLTIKKKSYTENFTKKIRP